MTELKHVIKNVATGEETIVDFTPEEIAQWEADKAEAEARRAAAQAEAERQAELKASARQKLITGQPLTEEEAATIVL